jgi:hypothetical protein
MSTVFRARDTDTGATVALKLLHVEGKEAYALDRFNREVRILSKLNHPRIAKYVSHGHTEQGHPFLVMEWLHGEDLAVHLRRGRLSLRAAFTIIRQAAEALAAVHQLGIVHRDIKPSNLFLCDGDPERVVLLDFGIAQRQTHAQSLIRAGAVIGTPGYMAPEQACGERAVLPSADIFSLGCLLFECLAGEPPFTSEHIAGALAKVLFEEPAPIRTRRPEVPQSLAVLLGRMLMKAPQHRIQDGVELFGQLQDIADLGLEHAAMTSPAQAADSWLADEQWLCTVVIAAPHRALMGTVTLSTEEMAQGATRRNGLRDALLDLGARAEWLPDGSLVTALTAASTGNVTDQVAVAARAALWIKEQWPEALVVLATGRAMMQAALPVGEAIDRAMRQLHELSNRRTRSPRTGTGPLTGRDVAVGVAMDELSADLLGPGFELRRNHDGNLLRGECTTADQTRPLLGRPTPCVGREQELQLLDTMRSGCFKQARACAVLIKAPPGVGKSRLRHEFLRRLPQSGSAPQVLIGQGDPLRAGSSSSLVGQLLRRRCDLRNGEDPAAQQAKLRRRLGRFLDEADRQPILDFLAELCNVSPSGGCAQLRTARRDPNAMIDWLTRSFVTWLRAECKHRPMVIILEDLHWGDPLGIKLIDEALRELDDMPLMVLALARPEVEQILPASWAGRVQQLSLQGLDVQASEALVKLVIGDLVDPAETRCIVQQAAGNALFLEELIRAAARPTKDTPPDTILAMLQARIGRLEAGARRVLATASLFGNTFWLGGILAMLRATCPPEEINAWLGLLVREEIISHHTESRFVADIEYVFRHALVCDAAYSLLTDVSRKQGHRLAGAFLENVGEPEAFSLAEHFARSDEPARATPWYIRAADRELARNDLDKTWLCAERGLQACPAGEDMGVLQSLQCTVAFWRHEWMAVYPFGAKALLQLAPGGLRWCTIVGYMLIGAGHTGQANELAHLVTVLTDVRPAPEARGTYLEAIAWLIMMFSILGDRGAARSHIERLGQLAETLPEDENCLGWKHMSHSVYKRALEADPWGAMVAARASSEAFRKAGAVRNWLMARIFLSYAEDELGSLATAEVTLRDAILEGQRWHHDPVIVRYGRAYLAWMLARRPDTERLAEVTALIMDLAARPEFSDSGNVTAHCALALQSNAAGDLQGAETYAIAACENSLNIPIEHLQALTVLIRIYLRQGQIEAAQRSATEGMALLSQLRCAGYAEIPFRLAAAEACHADGAFEAARGALQETLRQIQIRSAGIPDPVARVRYCSASAENARARLLARSWLGEDLTLAADDGREC